MKYSTFFVSAISISLTACFHENNNSNANLPIIELAPSFKSTIIDQANNFEIETFYNPDNAAGEDKVFGTSDDNVSYYIKKPIGAPINWLRSIYLRHSPPVSTNDHRVYSGPGTDLLWFTGDDELTAYTQTVTNGLTATQTHYNKAGIDNIWFTADDEFNFSSNRSIEYIDTGFIAKSFHSSSDTEPYLMHTLVKDAQDNIIREIILNQTFDENKLLIHQRLETINRNITFTDDYEIHKYDATVEKNGTKISGSLIKKYPTSPLSSRYDDFVLEETFGSGADSTLGTQDDILYRYKSNVVLEDSTNRTVIRTTNFTGSGPDNTWLTEDDHISSYIIITIEDNEFGQKTEQLTYYDHPGNDSIWFTNDDTQDEALALRTKSGDRFHITVIK